MSLSTSSFTASKLQAFLFVGNTIDIPDLTRMKRKYFQAGEDVVAVDGGKTNLTKMFKQTPQQKEARRSKLQQELSEAEEALGPAQNEMEQFVSEAELEVRTANLNV